MRNVPEVKEDIKVRNRGKGSDCLVGRWGFSHKLGSRLNYSLHRSRGETGRMANRDTVEIPNPNPQGVVTTTTFFSWALTNTVEYHP